MENIVDPTNIIN